MTASTQTPLISPFPPYLSPPPLLLWSRISSKRREEFRMVEPCRVSFQDGRLALRKAEEAGSPLPLGYFSSLLFYFFPLLIVVQRFRFDRVLFEFAVVS